LQTESSESRGRLSPDGHWLAYESNETGVPQVYVQTFPGSESKWQVSTEGGTRPVWRRKELFYIAEDNNMMAVDVMSGAGFGHGIPKIPDAQMLNPAEQEANAPMTVVVNWQPGLKK
jgi:hypothetical protein